MKACALSTMGRSRLGEDLCPGRRHLLGLRRDGAGLSRRAAIGTANLDPTPQLDQ